MRIALIKKVKIDRHRKVASPSFWVGFIWLILRISTGIIITRTQVFSNLKSGKDRWVGKINSSHPLSYPNSR